MPFTVQRLGDPLSFQMVEAGRNRSPWMRYGSVGVEFAAAVGGFGLLGWWIDSRYETGPWGLVTCAFLGLIGATYNLVRESLAAFKQAGAEDNERRSLRKEQARTGNDTKLPPEE